jgi:hypothetical protein
VNAEDNLSARATRMRGALAEERTTTVRLDRLWQLLATSEPDLARELAKRQVLSEVLDELRHAGTLELPKGARSWDRTGNPPLPVFIRRRVERAPSSVGRDQLRHPWVPDLSWAADLRLTDSQLSALVAINSWIARHPAQPRALPHRERSLQIFGEEKRLEELLGTPLFRPGRLSLELLAAYVVHPPFVQRTLQGATGDELLVVENHNTFDSIYRAATAHVAARRPCAFRFIAYGAGNAFEASVSYVADLAPRPSRVRYFGDLDGEGVTIPTRASGRAHRLALPAIAPHVVLYEMLLSLGHGQPTSARAAPTAWLGPVAPQAERLFAAGERLAQEWVTLEALERDSRWLS